ncbi:hypothetical protein WA158_007227 [Blastocystis sp. Blastoise]
MVQTILIQWQIDLFRKQKLKYLDALSYCVCNVLDLCSFIANVHDSTKYKQSAFSRLNELFTSMNASNDIFEEAEYVYNKKDQLNEDDQYAITSIYNDFIPTGHAIKSSTRQQYISLNNQMEIKNQVFMINIQNNKEHINISQKYLSEFMHQYPYVQYKKTLGGSYQIPLDNGIYSILPWISDEDSREKLLSATELRNPKNINVFRDILEIRKELANIQNYKSYLFLIYITYYTIFILLYISISISIQTFLSPAEVDTLLKQYMESISNISKDEIKILQAEKQKISSTPFKESDLGYYLGIYNSRTAGITAQDISKCFELKSILSNSIPKMFQDMYDVELRFESVEEGESWCDPSLLKKYTCYDHTGYIYGYIGTIYLDLYSRETKGVDTCTMTINSHYKDLEGSIHHPKCVVNTMFPVSQYISYTQCTSLFHELGHATCCLLSRGDYQFTSGVRCKTDFMEVISQLYEYIFSNNMIQFMIPSRGNERLANQLYKTSHRFEAITNLPNSIQYVFDHFVNSEEYNNNINLVDYYNSLRQSYYPIPVVKSNAFTSGQHFINYGGFFYSYSIGQSIAYDIYSTLANKYNGFINKDTGRHLINNYLQYGGNRHPKDILQSTLGRPFTLDSYLHEIQSNISS